MSNAWLLLDAIFTVCGVGRRVGFWGRDVRLGRRVVGLAVGVVERMGGFLGCGGVFPGGEDAGF
jgi:hypothetical protein